MLIDKKTKLKCELQKLISEFPNSFDEQRNNGVIDTFINDYFFDE